MSAPVLAFRNPTARPAASTRRQQSLAERFAGKAALLAETQPAAAELIEETIDDLLGKNDDGKGGA